MTRISSPLTDIKDQYTVVVVGSGYGGGIAASRLSRAGQSVCVLERGKEFLPGDFPDTMSTLEKDVQLETPKGHDGPRSGLFDFHIGPDINVLRGCGLGGTSLINANVALKAEPRVFDSEIWPAAIRADLETRLAEGYRLATEMLRPTPYPEDRPDLPKITTLKRSAKALGEPFYRTPINVNFEDLTKGNHVGVSQPACNDCGDCVSGCNHGSKNTTAMNYLPDAHNHGSEIFCEVLVDRVEKDGDRWRVYYTAASEDRDKFDSPDMFVIADIVVLGAGTLGSTEIMLRSAAAGLGVSECLGTRFSGNGDVLGFSYNNAKPVNGVGMGDLNPDDQEPVGPCITSIIDAREKPLLDDGIVIEEGVIPGALAKLLPEIMEGASALIGNEKHVGLVEKAKEKLRIAESLLLGARHGAVHNSQTYLVMAHDGAEGTMSLEQGRLSLAWPGVGKQPIYKTINDTLQAAADANQGTFIEDPIWTNFMKNSLLTVHPLGGCPMGEDAKTGVVDHKGRVFVKDGGTDVHAGLYIADGSVLPTSVGVNPLFTISAVAERTMALIAEDRGWSINYALPSKPRLRPEPQVAGVRFTESMKGYFSTKETQEFQAGFDRGESENSPFQFILTITADDANRLVDDPQHEAKMIGTVQAPALSKHPLTVTNGLFNLFVENPDEIGTLNMVYRMVLTGDGDTRYFFHGYKIVRDDTGPDLWSDTTTLYITVYEGTDDTGAVVGKGILHITPGDFAKQLTTMKAVHAPSKLAGLKALARFGALFAGDLVSTYANILAPSRVLHPHAEPRKRRSLRAPIPDVHGFLTDDGVALRLTRYQGGTKGPVMLAPGFGNKAEVYALDTTSTNFVEYLVANDYDVWLFDRRSSPALPSAAHPYSIDDVATYDWPAAVAEVRRLTRADDVQVVAHCMGSMTLLMAKILGLEGVRNAVCSQVTTYFETNAMNRLKARFHIAEGLSVLGVESVTTKVKPTWSNAILDKALALYPIPKGESCDNPVCHRIFGMFGPVYRHAQLNRATHLEMDQIFGIANTTVLHHLLAILGKGHVIDKDGNDVYMPHIDRLTFPIHFIAGGKNEIAFPSTSQRLYEELSELNGPDRYSRKQYEDYAHLDCFAGKDAATDIFPDLITELDRYN